MKRQPLAWLLLGGTLPTILVAMPVGYVALCGWQAGPAAIRADVFRPYTLDLLLNTLTLAGGVYQRRQHCCHAHGLVVQHAAPETLDRHPCHLGIAQLTGSVIIVLGIHTVLTLEAGTVVFELPTMSPPHAAPTIRIDGTAMAYSIGRPPVTGTIAAVM